MKFCPNCGASITPEMNNCPTCGSSLESNDSVDNNINQQEMNNTNNVNSSNDNSSNGFKPCEKNIALCILFSFITCGIYCIYWFYTLTEETNALSNENKTASGGLAILYSILTCGIYSLYWYYKAGKKLQEVTDGDESIVYLILGIFGLGLISYCLIQDKLNKLAK